MARKRKWRRKKNLPPNKLLWYEKRAKLRGYSLVAGIDEVGRGPLAGPVVACALLLKESGFREKIADSKKLSPREREFAFREIKKKAIWGLGIEGAQAIDRTDILRATQRAMEKAVSSLLEKLGKKSLSRAVYFLVDGNIRLKISCPYESFPRADALSLSVACASIVAKVRRDAMMASFDRRFPGYGFAKNKGYPTPFHLAALAEFGPSPIHRRTFFPVKKYFEDDRTI